MNSEIYDTEVYRRFYENFKPLLDGENIRHVDLRSIREEATRTGTKTRFGSYGWRSAVSSRVAPRTVYLGDKQVRLPKVTDLQRDIIEKSPEELHKVLHLMRTLPFVHLRRQMGNNREYNPICNLYVSIADSKNYRIGYMWGHTMRKPDRKPGPEFTMIHIPEEHQLRQQVLVLPEYNLNIALGTDYMGEDKKGFLRQAMWYADEHGLLGLHAGTKLVTVRDAKGDKLKTYGVFLFGLTATGKSTWSCHRLGLDHKRGEKTEVAQDDIVFLKKDGSALGSEVNFFVKTDVEKNTQEAMYHALIDKTALFENVMIDANGNPDFLDENLCANGRAVIRKDRLKVKRGRKLVGIDAQSIDLPSLDNLDGLVFAFITRRNTIMPFAQELTPQQGVLAYLWGESTHSYASQPARAGESVRIVGTDPFIIGSRAKKVNRFYDIVMNLIDNHPGKVKFYLYNTGGVGEIIEEYMDGDIKRKKMIRKVDRVPINLMAAIQRGDLRGTNRYEMGRLGRREIVECEGWDLSQFNAKNFYSEEQMEELIYDLFEGRKQFTGEIAEEGLKPEVLKAAEESFKLIKGRRPKVKGVPTETTETAEAEELEGELAAPLPLESKSRPRRPNRGRYR
jgi:phosphoenolpyruvate carboxykinase (ATP)